MMPRRFDWTSVYSNHSNLSVGQIMKDTLNFVGDGDDLEVIGTVERTFEIKITDAEAVQTRTVGQLYDLIELKRQNAGSRTQACLSRLAFYRLRRALKAMDIEGEITPQTPVSVLEQIEPRSVAAKWRQLAQSSGLDLPGLETSFRASESIVRWRAPFAWGALMGLWVAFGIPFDYRLFVLMAGAFCLDIGLGCLGWWIFRTIPRRILTIGELAREAAGASFAKLITENKDCAPSDRWFALTAILRGITGHKIAITRQTTFFAEHATHDLAI